VSVRLCFVVEGQTEETFVQRLLVPHLSAFSVWARARCVLTGRKRGLQYRGGLQNYAKVQRDISVWMKEDRHPDVFFTTMFDLYALPNDFPGYADAVRERDPYRRVGMLEAALSADIGDRRFIPYIQLHEFEALLLAEPHSLDLAFPERLEAIRALSETVELFASPELIDDGSETAPSKRIIRHIPEYEGMKTFAGPLVAGKIGIETLRSKCAHFGEWLGMLEQLGCFS